MNLNYLILQVIRYLARDERGSEDVVDQELRWNPCVGTGESEARHFKVWLASVSSVRRRKPAPAGDLLVQASMFRKPGE